MSIIMEQFSPIYNLLTGQENHVKFERASRYLRRWLQRQAVTSNWTYILIDKPNLYKCC